MTLYSIKQTIFANNILHNQITNMPVITRLLLLSMLSVALASCEKQGTAKGDYALSYGDSILYLKSNGNNLVYPTERREGYYEGFPEGIEIDEETGAIDVQKSEAGLRYRITHMSPDGITTETKVVISGINFPDHFYRLSQGDSIALPVYNADPSRQLPMNSVFDEGSIANASGCDVQIFSGNINLKKSVRNGVFGSSNPENDARRDIDIYYRLNDNSNKTLNKIRVRLYWYNTMNDVPADLLQELQDRQTAGVFLRANQTNPLEVPVSVARTQKVAKPRPPCVIIVGQ